MKKSVFILLTVVLLAGCSTGKDLAYLNNLSETGGEGYFTMDVPFYKIQPRDILYISVKTQTSDGSLEEILTGRATGNTSYMMQSEASQYVSGYSVDPSGMLNVPLLGKISVSGKNIYEARDILQTYADSLFRHAYVEVRLLSFKFTVIGEVRVPGSYVNYNDQLTVLEAIGRAGGLTDVGDRKDILVVRPVDKKTVTYKINLQEKSLLESPAYFLSPNDVVIVQASGKKIFNLNLPTYAFITTTVFSAITSTLLLINYFK
jgi:polysaccharide biosynthesis/export protein